MRGLGSSVAAAATAAMPTTAAATATSSAATALSALPVAFLTATAIASTFTMTIRSYRVIRMASTKIWSHRLPARG